MNEYFTLYTDIYRLRGERLSHRARGVRSHPFGIYLYLIVAVCFLFVPSFGVYFVFCFWGPMLVLSFCMTGVSTVVDEPPTRRVRQLLASA